MSYTFTASTTGASVRPAILSQATQTTHAHAYANKFWATKNFAAYGASGTWSSIR